jgi:DNA-binding CsgD family transcriptional regulator
MVDTITSNDVRSLVELLEEARRDRPAAGLPPIVLERAQALVRCDQVGFVDFDPTGRRYYLDQVEADVLVDPDGGDPDADPFWANYWDCQFCSYPSVSGDDRTVITISDYYSQRQWHQSGMYRDCVTGTEHEAILCIYAPRGRTRRLLLARGHGPDFDHRDRLVLSLLRPHLNELYQDLESGRRPDCGLTARQRELLRFVADGYTNKEIARQLVVSVTTVRTHMENIFRQLDVTNRSAAVAKAFPTPPY